MGNLIPLIDDQTRQGSSNRNGSVHEYHEQLEDDDDDDRDDDDDVESNNSKSFADSDGEEYNEQQRNNQYYVKDGITGVSKGIYKQKKNKKEKLSRRMNVLKNETYITNKTDETGFHQ